MGSGCLFCKISQNEISSQRIGESENVFCIADVQPQAQIHWLLIPKTHVASLNDLSADQRKNLLPEIFSLADQLIDQKGLRAQGYRIVINNQGAAGQSVFHLHVHVLSGPKLRGVFGA